ncbi:MAG: helix-turn-helix transcriptional regulator [Bacteroidota bacterium]
MENNNMQAEFDELLSFNTEKEELSHDAVMLSLKFISEINELLQENQHYSKKDIAEYLNTSPSFVTQLFKGDRKLSMDLLAKFQKLLKTEFSISTCEKQLTYPHINLEIAKQLTFKEQGGFWAFHNTRSYESKEGNLVNKLFDTELKAS